MSEAPIKLPLGIAEIKELIPHRYPMLLIDRVIGFEDGVRIVGLKSVTVNEPFFQGHFPDKPLMPGVLILEALAQLGVIFAKLCSDGDDRADSFVVFAGADNVKWRRTVTPGDVLTLEMSLLRKRRGLWKMQGTAMVGAEKAMEGVLTASALT